MDRLRRFMFGRYGGDELSKALLVLSFILLLIMNFVPKDLRFLTILAYIPVIICMFRIFTRNIYKRRNENYKYLKIKNKIVMWFKNNINRIKTLKNYKYYTCSNCKQKLRVPRGKGKISITCPKCNSSFKGKS
jgi:DNA-directed RNA polymerase subunit RPC12/RpoP